MAPDPNGYLRLRRALTFIAQELREAGETEPVEQVERAIAFFGGSPSEFLGESLIALEHVLGCPVAVAPSTHAFVDALASEMREGFARIEGA